MISEKYPRFPLFISLEGREVLIVGAGRVAVRRAGILLRFGCRIRMCAPESIETLQSPLKDWIEEKKICYESGKFHEDVLTGEECLVLAATSEEETNMQIVKLCKERGIPVNNSSDYSACDFFFPSVLHDQEIVIGITGDGTDHKRVKKVRKRIQDMLKGENRPK